MSNYGVNGSGDGEGDRWIPGRGRGRGAWNSKPPQEPQALRRPHQAPSGSQENQAESDILQKSTLSPEAAEFVPSYFQNIQPLVDHIPSRPSVQGRFEQARQGQSHINNMYQHYHQQLSQQNYYPDNQQVYQYDPRAVNPDVQYSGACSNDPNTLNQRQPRRNNVHQAADLNMTISQMESSIRDLTLSPGKFDCLVSHLVDIISPFLEDPSQSRDIIKVIIKQSINESNFRYNGARLCTHLDTVSNPTDRRTSTFREILLQQCQDETQQQGNNWQCNNTHSDEEEKKCHGLILFLAELVTQMHSSAPTLGKMLIQLISTVLRKPAPTSAKNICQALKLAGQTLERDNAGGRKDMEAVMRQLTNLVIEGRVDSHVGRMVHSVTELRSNSWGRAMPSITPTYRPPAVTPNVSSRSQEALDEPVFYGPDGKVISAEESEFLQDLTKDSKDTDEFGDDDFDGEYLDGDDEQDDVITAAYEEFLKLSENSNNQMKNK